LTEIEAARQLLVQDMKILEPYSSRIRFILEPGKSLVTRFCPTSTSFLSSQASRYEFNWKKSFFGTHYDRLRAIKEKYDPESLFLVYEGIGSDEWDVDLICPV
jgi:hypothetical protein